MSNLLAIAGIAISAAMIGLVIKKDAPQMSAAITIITGIFIMFSVLGGISDMIQQLSALSEVCGLKEQNLLPLIKILGISVVSKITSELCKDMGEGALAAKIELAGAVAAGIITLPLLSNVIGIFNDLI